MCIAGIASGLMIGYGFGKFQEMALARNQQRQQKGLLHNGWSLMPGSFTRVAMLLLVLVVVQVTCPLLFTRYVQWCVSGGVMLGYGIVLWRRIVACR
jgi:hypothetical protein